MTKRIDTTVKLDARVAETARKVAALKGKSLVEYLSEVLAPIVQRDLKAEGRKLTKGDED